MQIDEHPSKASKKALSTNVFLQEKSSLRLNGFLKYQLQRERKKEKETERERERERKREMCKKIYCGKDSHLKVGGDAGDTERANLRHLANDALRLRVHRLEVEILLAVEREQLCKVRGRVGRKHGCVGLLIVELLLPREVDSVRCLVLDSELTHDQGGRLHARPKRTSASHSLVHVECGAQLVLERRLEDAADGRDTAGASHGLDKVNVSRVELLALKL